MMYNDALETFPKISIFTYRKNIRTTLINNNNIRVIS